MLCSYPSMGALTDRFGSRRVSASGALISLLGTLPFAVLPFTALSTWAICTALFVRGPGSGRISIPSIAAAYSSIAKEAIPAATTAINIVQRLGGPIATTARNDSTFHRQAEEIVRHRILLIAACSRLDGIFEQK